jgi:hypothetical protein
MKSGNYFGRAGLALILSVVVTLTACSTAWVGQAEEIVAALIPAAANLLALVAALQGKGVSATDLQAIQSAGSQAGADLQLIQSLITQYQKADAAAQPGILNQIESAVGTAQANLNGILPALHIKDAATQAKISAVVGILVAEVQSLAAIVPLVKVGTVDAPTLAAKSAARVGHPRVPLTASEFVGSYNATMTAKTGNVDLDRATAGLEIHRHGKFARWASVGMLK